MIALAKFVRINYDTLDLLNCSDETYIKLQYNIALNTYSRWKKAIIHTF